MVCMWELLDLHVHKSKEGNTTNLNVSFSVENEKRAAQVGIEPMIYCLRGRCSTNQATEAAQLAGPNQGSTRHVYSMYDKLRERGGWKDE